jgi:hypothetical protein
MSEELILQRRAMVNICLLVLCQLLSWLTLLVDIIDIGENCKVAISGITITKTWPGGEQLTFTTEISKFDERYCTIDPKEEICPVIQNLKNAEYLYKMLLLFNLFIVSYCILNLWFTAFKEKIPKLFRFYYSNYIYPLTYVIGCILYFTISNLLTLDISFTFSFGFYSMTLVVIISIIAGVFNKLKINSFYEKNEISAPLVEDNKEN